MVWDNAPDWFNALVQWLAVALAVATAVSRALEAAVPRLEDIARRTEWQGDDEAVSWLARFSRGLATALDYLQVFTPRVTLGRPRRLRARDTPSIRPPPPGPPIAGLLVVVSACLLGGCGAASPRATLDDSLGTIAAAVDPAYEAAVDACDAAEAYAIARADTYDEGTDALIEIRERCDKAFAAFEAIRRAHLVATTATEEILEEAPQ